MINGRCKTNEVDLIEELSLLSLLERVVEGSRLAHQMYSRQK